MVFAKRDSIYCPEFVIFFDEARRQYKAFFDKARGHYKDWWYDVCWEYCVD